jgi:hypothetical protein
MAVSFIATKKSSEKLAEKETQVLTIKFRLIIVAFDLRLKYVSEYFNVHAIGCDILKQENLAIIEQEAILLKNLS